MVVQDGLPPTLTGGQKTKSETKRSTDLGLQGHFLPPPEGIRPGEEKSSRDDFSRENFPRDVIQIGLDWLQMTFHPSPLIDEVAPDQLTGHQRLNSDVDDAPPPAKNEFMDRVLLATSIALGCEPQDWHEIQTWMYGYQRALLGPGGARMLFDAPGRIDFHVQMPGQACGMVGQPEMLAYLEFCHASEAVCTRVDMKLDDYARVQSVEGVRAAIQSAECVTHAKKWQVVKEGDVGNPEDTGDTVYLGRKASRQLLRVYDKGKESGGEIDAVRWELQSRAEPAITMVDRLRAEPWGEVVASRLRTFVDFRDVNSSSKIELRVQLAWYAELIGNARKASAYLAKLPRTVGAVIAWIDHQVGTSLAMAFRVWRGDIAPLVDILKEGERRLKPKHLAMLARSV